MSAAEQLPPDAIDALTQRVAEARRSVDRRDLASARVALEEAFRELDRVQTSALAAQPRAANAAQGGGGCGAAAPAAPSLDVDARPPARWMRRQRGGSLAHAFIVEGDAEPNRVSLCHTAQRGQRGKRNEWVRAEPGDARCRHCGRWARDNRRAHATTAT